LAQERQGLAQAQQGLVQEQRVLFELALVPPWAELPV
jgi:hypothetical protein